MGLDYRTASHQQIIDYCRSDARIVVDQWCEFANPVVKLSDEAVVKFNPGLTQRQATNQIEARRYVHDNICRIPRVYRFIQTTTDGYLVMEYMQGTRLTDIDIEKRPDLMQRVMDALTHFAQIPGPKPGPLSGGEPEGLLWSEYGACTTFETIADMVEWFNVRLALVKRQIDLSTYPLVLCHLDLARRNIIEMQDGSICFLDWDHAGWYPEMFEASVLERRKHEDLEWFELLLANYQKLSSLEWEQLKILPMASFMSERFACFHKSDRTITFDGSAKHDMPPPTGPEVPKDVRTEYAER